MHKTWLNVDECGCLCQEVSVKVNCKTLQKHSQTILLLI